MSQRRDPVDVAFTCARSGLILPEDDRSRSLCPKRMFHRPKLCRPRGVFEIFMQGRTSWKQADCGTCRDVPRQATASRHESKSFAIMSPCNKATNEGKGIFNGSDSLLQAFSSMLWILLGVLPETRDGVLHCCQRSAIKLSCRTTFPRVQARARVHCTDVPVASARMPRRSS